MKGPDRAPSSFKLQAATGLVLLRHSGLELVRPLHYGPKKTLYNRFVRWAAKGIWRDLFETLARAGGPPSQVLIDSSAVKAHRCASGGKGGSKAMPSAARGVDAPPRSTRSPTGSAARSPSC